MADAPMDPDARGRLDEFLLAEFSHASESLVSNEELGDRRLSLFLAVAVAVLGAIGALFMQEEASAYLYPFAAIGLIFLLLLGRQTLLRILDRNCETDRLLHSLKEIRKQFVHSDDREMRLLLAHDPFEKERPPRSKRPMNPLTAKGLVETTILLNSLLAGVLVAVIVAGAVPMLQPGAEDPALFAAMVVPGTLVALLVGIVETCRARRYYANHEGTLVSTRKE